RISCTGTTCGCARTWKSWGTTSPMKSPAAITSGNTGTRRSRPCSIGCRWERRKRSMVLIHAGYFSHELGMCMQSDVLLPQSEGPHRVLWLLHGASDDETAWQRRTSIERYVEGTGLAVVMPCGHLSSYVNMAH